jgi:hypothetical protein
LEPSSLSHDASRFAFSAGVLRCMGAGQLADDSFKLEWMPCDSKTAGVELRFVPDLGTSSAWKLIDEAQQMRNDVDIRTRRRQLWSGLPEVSAGPRDASPGADVSGHVQKDHEVRLAAHVCRDPINNPGRASHKTSLSQRALFGRRLHPAWLPNNGVEREDWKVQYCPKPSGERALPRPRIPRDVDAHNQAGGYRARRLRARRRNGHVDASPPNAVRSLFSTIAFIWSRGWAVGLRRRDQGENVLRLGKAEAQSTTMSSKPQGVHVAVREISIGT